MKKRKEKMRRNENYEKDNGMRRNYIKVKKERKIGNLREI